MPTSLPLDLQFTGSNSPISDLIPAIDQDIAFLVEAVSRQNLTGYVQTLESFGTRNTFSDTEQDDISIAAQTELLTEQSDTILENIQNEYKST